MTEKCLKEMGCCFVALGGGAEIAVDESYEIVAVCPPSKEKNPEAYAKAMLGKTYGTKHTTRGLPHPT